MKRRQKAGFLIIPEKLQNHRNERKRKEKKKERGGRKEGKRKKAMVAFLVFIMAALEIVYSLLECSILEFPVTR